MMTRPLFAMLLLSGLAPALHAEPAAQAGLHRDAKLEIGGEKREFSYYVPRHAQGKPLPMVIYFHGHGDSGRHLVGKGIAPSVSAVWMETAEREKFLVFYPLGLKGKDRKTGWNDCRGDADGNPKADDTQFTKALIEFAHANLGLDRSRVYVTGMSNGGHMTMRVAMEMADQVAAAATIVALMPRNSRCDRPSRPVPMLFMHGTEDKFAPFGGGSMTHDRGVVYSARETVDLWRQWNGVQNVPEKTTRLPDLDKSDHSVMVMRTWADAAGRNVVVAYEMRGAGHAEPSRKAKMGRLLTRVQGNQNHDVEMADAVWDFFKDHSRNPGAGSASRP